MDKRIESFVVGEEIQGFFIIKAINVKTSSNHKKYLDLTFADKTGEVNGKLWDANDTTVSTYKTGNLVKVRGTVTSWQNHMQLKIARIRLANDDDQIQITDYVPAAPFDPVEMYDEIKATVDAFTNEQLKKLVGAVLETYREPLLTAPAAKSNHHAIRSGLLYHIKRMIQTGKGLCQVYSHINQDLLISGIILHDMEKINEMVADDLGIVSSYSREGQLLGHIIMGIKKIDEMAKKLDIDQELSLMLQHLVLTHHYEAEFGSPKKPMIPEGELLHYIDVMDARMYDMTLALKDTPAGEFTDPVWVLDKRRLYNFSGNEEA